MLVSGRDLEVFGRKPRSANIAYYVLDTRSYIKIIPMRVLWTFHSTDLERVHVNIQKDTFDVGFARDC